MQKFDKEKFFWYNIIIKFRVKGGYLAMAKVPFSKLQLCVNGCDCTNSYMNRDGVEIKYEVKHYLPMKDKIDLITRVINQSVDDNGFYNPMRVKLFLTLEMVYAYTNLSFTEKQKEDPFKLYDLLVSTGVFQDVIKQIFDGDWETIQADVWDTIENIYKYRNSVMGILEAVKDDYGNLSLDASTIQNDLSNPENMELLRNVLDKLG